MAGKGAMALECPRCGGQLEFDPTTQKLKCIYCDSLFTTEEAEAHFAEKEKKTAEKSEGVDAGGENDGMCAYTCSNCSAELMADATTAVIRCPYCGNNTVAASQFSGDIRPDRIIPFTFTKEQAVEKYNEYYKHNILVPSAFVRDCKIDEIQGVYVPFWLYDGTVNVNGEYEATDTTEDSSTKTTKYYQVLRTGDISFENIPADASKRMADELMDSIEPYDFSALKDFSIIYLPGFLAERYNVTDDDNKKRADERIKGSARLEVHDTIKHDSFNVKKESFKIDYTGEKYALLPVWYFTAKWKDKDFKFAMNGQTGEFTGDLPVSPIKLILSGCVAFAITFGILYLLTHGIPLGVFIGIIVALITMYAGYACAKPVVKASNANKYITQKIKLSLEQDVYLRKETEKIKK